MFYPSSQNPQKRECRICGEKKWVAKILGVCGDCVEEHFSKAKKYISEAHAKIRSPYGLPYPPPKSTNSDSVVCNLCANECQMAPGDRSFCGLRKNVDGTMQGKVSPRKALLYTYTDPIPTNCCASWFCPAGTGGGYPKYAHTAGTEHNYKNLAVFFYGCNFNCFFCQNACHKQVKDKKPTTRDTLAKRVLQDEQYACLCYFGGSPEPQLPFVLSLNRYLLEHKEDDRILRICFEWNGAGNQDLVKQVGKQALKSGGIIKFDLKAPSSKLSLALSGVRNERIYQNFEMLYNEYYHKRPSIPLLTATTLLVPGYIEPNEVERIAKKIAHIDEKIPYSLLVFHPDFKARDLPVTPKQTAKECFNRAKNHLEHVHLGNKHLLAFAPSNP